MKDKHNVILTLVSSSLFNFFFRSGSSYHILGSRCFIFSYRSSSWRFYMMVHQGFNSFSKCSLRFFSEELKYSSSCIPKCNSFYCIIWVGIMSFLIIWVHVFMIHMLSRMGYLKSINLFIGVILGHISPKAFP